MRKERSLLRKEWKSIRENIEQVIRENKLESTDFKAVGINDWEEIEKKILDTFCNFPLSYKYRPSWLSTYFKLDTASLSNLVAYAPQYIDELIAPEERVWFFVNDSKSKFWYYEGNYRTVKKVIDESCWTEFYIASKKCIWLVNMTHSDVLLVTGNELPDKLRVIKERVDPICNRKFDQTNTSGK